MTRHPTAPPPNNSPVIGDAGNMAAVGAEAHRSDPAVVRSSGKNGRGGREEVPEGGERSVSWAGPAPVASG